MWIEGNYRRNLMDMHIDDWDPVFLSKLDPDAYVAALKDAGVQAAMIKGKPHTGLCYYPTKIARMHKGLKGFDFFGAMVKKCHENGIAAEGYFTQIFDNWAYENHPEWRIVTGDGKGMRDYRGEPNFKSGRYGIVCPNNEGYRQYVRDSLAELVGNYDIDGIFLDMTFWPEVCYCPACREKYRKRTGKELPVTVDWADPEWREFVYIREEWMAEYAQFATECVKRIKPAVTVEHQFSMITAPWIFGSTEMLTDHVDYSGGDYYGSFLQQTFINKYYKNVSPNLPFIYHTSRCDPELVYHTATKTPDELLLHVITALVHNGAFLLVDAINPDGTFVPSVYHDLMKKIYANTSRFEKYISGDLVHDAAIWFASHAKYDTGEPKTGVMQKTFSPKYYMECPLGAASVMRADNIPFEVIGTKNIRKEKAKVLILSHVAEIRDEEMDEIEAYLRNGGSLLISGTVANKRLQELAGIRVTGTTEHSFTYMSPTKEAGELGLFKGFDEMTPLTVPDRQVTAEIADGTDLTVLATLTLPYTMTDTSDFAAIHSNPPGIHTDRPCAVLKKLKTGGKIIWTAAPVEISRPYMSREAFADILRYMIATPSFTSNAPKFVEVLEWEKGGERYFAVINEQEEAPIAPMYEISIDVETDRKKAVLLPDGGEMDTSYEDGVLHIRLPKLEVFLIFKLS
jgi:hypothetical protein